MMLNQAQFDEAFPKLEVIFSGRHQCSVTNGAEHWLIWPIAASDDKSIRAMTALQKMGIIACLRANPRFVIAVDCGVADPWEFNALPREECCGRCDAILNGSHRHCQP